MYKEAHGRRRGHDIQALLAVVQAPQARRGHHRGAGRKAAAATAAAATTARGARTQSRVWLGAAHSSVQGAHPRQIGMNLWWLYLISAVALIIGASIVYVLIRTLYRLVIDYNPPLRILIVKEKHA